MAIFLKRHVQPQPPLFQVWYRLRPHGLAQLQFSSEDVTIAEAEAFAFAKVNKFYRVALMVRHDEKKELLQLYERGELQKVEAGDLA